MQFYKVLIIFKSSIKERYKIVPAIFPHIAIAYRLNQSTSLENK